GGSDPLHGNGGEWRVERQRLRWELLDAFQQAAAEVGIPPTEDFNRGDNLGCGYFEVNQRRGIRWNAAKAFLRPALKRPNLKVITAAHVHRLLHCSKESRRIDGVECLVGPGVGERKRFKARGEVILSAGAI